MLSACQGIVASHDILTGIIVSLALFATARVLYATYDVLRAACDVSGFPIWASDGDCRGDGVQMTARISAL